jgi:hypothetical protein
MFTQNLAKNQNNFLTVDIVITIKMAMQNEKGFDLTKAIATYAPKQRILPIAARVALVDRLVLDIQDGRHYAHLSLQGKNDLLRMLEDYKHFVEAAQRAHSPKGGQSSKEFYIAVASYAYFRKKFGTADHEQLSRAVIKSTLENRKPHIQDSAHSDTSASAALWEILTDLTAPLPIPKTLRKVFAQATGYLHNEFAYLAKKLTQFSDLHDESTRQKVLKNTFTPDTGPDTLADLVHIMGLLSAAGNNLTPHPWSNPQKTLLASLSALNGNCQRIQVSKEGHTGFPTFLTRQPQQKKSSFELIRDAGLTIHEIPYMALGMGRYFLEHHRDSLTAKQAVKLNSALADLYLQCYALQLERDHDKPHNSAHSPQRKATNNLMLYHSWGHWPKPPVADVLDFYQDIFQPRRGPPDGFDFDVCFYSESSDVTRGIRQYVFPNQEGYRDLHANKQSFLKNLATCQADTLKEAGFTDADISFMSRTGQISKHLGSEQHWVIGFIVDTYAGGSYAVDNMCLLPQELFTARENFLSIQTECQATTAYKEDGHWILTLRPNTLRNGIGFLPQKALPSPLTYPENQGPR